MVIPLSSVPFPLSPVWETREGLSRRMGAKKADTPLEGWVLARRMVMWESVADENHLKPEMDHGPRGMDSDCDAKGTGAEEGKGS